MRWIKYSSDRCRSLAKPNQAKGSATPQRSAIGKNAAPPTWHREFLTTKSVPQSRNLSQTRKTLGPLRPDWMEQESPSCACKQDEAGRKSIRVAAAELRASRRRWSRLQ